MRRSLVVSLLLLTMATESALAQTCLGLGSYSAVPLQVTGNGWLSSEASSLGAGVGYGRPSSVFASLAVGTTSNETFDGSILEVGGSLGYQIPLGAAERFQLCPVVSLGAGLGPNNAFDSGVDRSSRSASLGIAVATSLVASPQLRVVPTVGLAYAYRLNQAESAAGASLFEITYHYARAQLGVGLILNSNVFLRPSAEIPLGLTGNGPAFGVTLGYNFGISRRSRSSAAP